MTKKITKLIVISVIFFCSCNNRPSYVLSDNVMETLLFDLYKAEAAVQMDSLQPKSLLKAVLKKYHVSQQSFDSTLCWYNANLDYFIKINNRLIVRLSSIDDSLSCDDSLLLLPTLFFFPLSVLIL